MQNFLLRTSTQMPNFFNSIPTGGITFDGITGEVRGWVAAVVALVLMYLATKHFFGKSFGQLIVSLLVGGFVYFVVKNTDSVLNAVSSLFGQVFN